MIECKLVKLDSRGHIGIVNTDRDLFEDSSISLGMTEETLNKFLDIQDKFRKMQQYLKVLYEIHSPK